MGFIAGVQDKVVLGSIENLQKSLRLASNHKKTLFQNKNLRIF
jgi:hypothetical protein